MKHPNFFILGAPKCGTTTLAHWLKQTSDCFMSPVKEPHFYAHNYTANFNGPNFKQHDRAEYLALFDGASQKHAAVGEASTHYLRSPDAIDLIHKDYPLARFVVCLRNPVDMARSMHSHSVYHGREQFTSFEKAWRAQSARQGGGKILSWCINPDVLQFRSLCSLGEQVQHLLSVVQREQVHFVVMDDIKSDALGTYHALCTFLGCRANEIDLSARNVSRVRRSHLLNMVAHSPMGELRGMWRLAIWNNKYNVSTNRPARIPATLRAEVTNAFADDVALLEELTGLDLSSWK